MFKVETKSYADIFAEFNGAVHGNDGSVEAYLNAREEDGLILFAIAHAHGSPRFIFAGKLEVGTYEEDPEQPEQQKPEESGDWVEKVPPKGGADENDRKAPPDGGSE